MTLNEMRRALESAAEGPDSPASTEPTARLAPASRGVTQSRSCLVEVDLPGEGGSSSRRKGTLTFANTVGDLKRAGSSRGVRSGGTRTAPRRAQSCLNA